MSLALTKIQMRAESLARARSFFAERNVLEVDCGALVRSPPLDANIDVMSVAVSNETTGYLHTSPEYAMKRLLSQGSGDIYFLGHVYRKGEAGYRHSPEFTMAEWYRIGFSLPEMIEETACFIETFIGPRRRRILTYRQAFADYVEVDYSKATLDELRRAVENKGLSLSPEAKKWSRETLLDVALSHLIEPQLGQGELTILTDYPPEQAALACVAWKNGEEVAERFEIYSEGLELANGYHELSDGSQLRRRFAARNRERIDQGKEPYPLDETLLEAIESSHFPPCCGVSVGFDRVLMLREKVPSIEQILLDRLLIIS